MRQKARKVLKNTLQIYAFYDTIQQIDRRSGRELIGVTATTDASERKNYRRAIWETEYKRKSMPFLTK